jgi:predicted Zn-dependent protease
MEVLSSLTGGRMNFAVPPPRHTVINGMEAAITTARVNTSSGVLDVSVAAYRWDPQRVYYFVMLTPAGYGISPFIPMLNSLRRITPQEAASIRPRIIHVVTVGPGDTIQSLASQMAYRDYKLDRFLTINGLSPGSRLVPGQKVKLVVYGARRT